MVSNPWALRLADEAGLTLATEGDEGAAGNKHDQSEPFKNLAELKSDPVCFCRIPSGKDGKFMRMMQIRGASQKGCKSHLVLITEQI